MKIIGRTIAVICIILTIWVAGSTCSVISQNSKPGASYSAFNFYSMVLSLD